MSAAEDCINEPLHKLYGAYQRWSRNGDSAAADELSDGPSALVAALRADPTALADLADSRTRWTLIGDIARKLHEATARAEKAEQERDALRLVLRATPMTTVDEDGRVCRMEMATDGADCLYLTREGFATTIPAHSADRALYVLVPIEDAPSEGEGE